MSSADNYPLLIAQRRDLCDIADGFTTHQWATPSLCAGWSVRDVVCHLLGPVEFSAFKSVGPLLKARFNFDVFTQHMVAADDRSGEVLTTALRNGAEVRWTPPGFGFEAPLTDIVVHSLDIVCALGIEIEIDKQAQRAVLDFLVTKKATRGFVSTDRLRGLRFEADDLNWGFGTGPVVAGPANDLLIAICGRRVSNPRLRGPGSQELLTRLG